VGPHGWRAWGLLLALLAVAALAAVALAVRATLTEQSRLVADECRILAMREAIAVYYRLHGAYPERPGRYAECATLTPAQERALAEVRRFVEATARLYGVPPLAVVAGPYVRGLAASYRPGLLLIAPPVLTGPDRDATVAHELAHQLLRHGAPRVGAAAPAPSEQARREADANAKSVEILVRVRGWPERTALAAVYEKLLRQHRAVTAGQAIVAPGHAAPCEELRDLLGRFPQHRAWTARLECA